MVDIEKVRKTLNLAQAALCNSTLPDHERNWQVYSQAQRAVQETLLSLPKPATCALTQRPAAQTEREADGYGSTDIPWSFTVCRELEPQEKRLMSMLVSAFGSEHPAIDDMAHLILNRPASLPAPQQATPEPERITVQEAWEAAGGNPGIKASKADLMEALRQLDKVCDEATPEPVGEPVAWWYGTHPRPSIETIRLDHTFTDHAGEYIKGRPLVFGDTHPAPGVPEGWKLRVTDLDGRKCLVIESPEGQAAALSTASRIAGNVLDALAAAQAKGGEHD